MEDLIIYHLPELNRPYLVAGFAGWANAAEVSTGAVSYLKDKLAAEKFAEIKPDDFYDFSSLRPLAAIDNSLLKELKPPSNEFFCWRNKKRSHDLVIFLGIEPHLRWNRYVDLVLDLAEQLGVKKIYTVGGLYDQIPHTREPKVSGVVNKPGLRKELRRYDIDLANYKGPSSVHTLLLFASARRNLRAVSLWGHVPHYIPMYDPKVSYGVLRRLTEMLKLEIDLEDLRTASDRLDEQLNKAIHRNPEFGEHVRKLEEGYPVAEGKYEDDRIIGEVEEFLRKRGKNHDSRQA